MLALGAVFGLVSLVEGFYVPVLEEIEVEELREDLTERVRERLRARE